MIEIISSVIYILIGYLIAWKMSDRLLNIKQESMPKALFLSFLCIFVWPGMIIAGIIKDKQ